MEMLGERRAGRTAAALMPEVRAGLARGCATAHGARARCPVTAAGPTAPVPPP
ncbi:hypothetical protein [Streptomyces sp. NPDC058572]|uniref:hypothetical protein n=1 Tax=Streptomyces sp. NPDC058572 TaxID=3346546 RepID=UPI00364F3456